MFWIQPCFFWIAFILMAGASRKRLAPANRALDFPLQRLREHNEFQTGLRFVPIICPNCETIAVVIACKNRHLTTRPFGAVPAM